jgi:hypothetical protein
MSHKEDGAMRFDGEAFVKEFMAVWNAHDVACLKIGQRCPPIRHRAPSGTSHVAP